MKISIEYDNETEGTESLFDTVSLHGNAVSTELFADLLMNVIRSSIYSTAQVLVKMIEIECEYDATDLVRIISNQRVEDLYRWKQEDKEPKPT
jgi:hypothetical protein